jgi:hypothetical protein
VIPLDSSWVCRRWEQWESIIFPLFYTIAPLNMKLSHEFALLAVQEPNSDLKQQQLGMYGIVCQNSSTGEALCVSVPDLKGEYTPSFC